MAMIGVDEQECSTDAMAQCIALRRLAASLDHRFDGVGILLSREHQRCNGVLYLEAMKVILDLLAVHQHFSGTAGREFHAGDGGLSLAGTVVVLVGHYYEGRTRETGFCAAYS